MKNDGIYSKYFNVMALGAGTYNFEAVVTDNGNTAYSWQEYTKQKSELFLTNNFEKKVIF